MRYLFLIIFSISIIHKINAQGELLIEAKEDIAYKDSIGNKISSKQAIDLLKTGKYISVPVVNDLMQMEHIIRKPNKKDAERYQTYTDQQTVIVTSSVKKPKLKFNLGDTVPPLIAFNYLDERFDLSKSSANELSVLLFYKDDLIWVDTQPAFKVLISDYPNVNFVLCTPDEKKQIGDFFDKRTLKLNSSIFIADSDFLKQLSVESYPICMVINQIGKLLIFVPPLPRQEITIQFLRKYLSSATKD